MIQSWLKIEDHLIYDRTIWYSKKLNLRYAVTKFGDVYFEDGTKYSGQEINLLVKSYGKLQIDLLHRIKKEFEGLIIL